MSDMLTPVRIETNANITASVGSGGINRFEDVRAIQVLLNENAGHIQPFVKLAVDGKIGPKSIEAIVKFQRKVVGLQNPDGRVDPNGKTLSALKSSSGSPVAPGGTGAPKADVGCLQLKVERFDSSGNSMIGKLYLQGRIVCYTLEPAWRNNARGKSCVPSGTYQAYLRYTSLKSKREWCIELTNAYPREAIQVHIGNNSSDTEGCILVGLDHGKDKISRSDDAYQKLQDEIFGAGFTRKQIRDAQPNFGVVTVQFTDPLGGPVTRL